MISRIEALNFRSLRHVKQDLGPFHILVGSNASGKSTFLDVVAFLGQLVSEGLEAAVETRTRDFKDLVWGRDETYFELAIEAPIPDELRSRLGPEPPDLLRYEVMVGQAEPSAPVGILNEKLLLLSAAAHGNQAPKQRMLFPQPNKPGGTIMTGRAEDKARVVINKSQGGVDQYTTEVLSEKRKKSWTTIVKWGPRKSALGSLPADEGKFPVASWLRDLLTVGVRTIRLGREALAFASPANRRIGFQPDGSNLPWAIESLKSRDPGRYGFWITHLRTALEDLVEIRTVEREDDRHRYLMLKYESGIEVPSWTASDGTLRLLALTLPAYSVVFKGLYLIEEPENGIHPLAIEPIFQSLSSVYDAQVMLATHSPVLLSLADPATVLCFAKTPNGETDVVRGSEHPALKEWRGETDLGTLFASGILGKAREVE